MKIAVLIARILLGLVFLVFGSNAFLHFIPTGPMPPGPAGQFLGALFASHYLYVIGFFQVVPAVLLLANRYVPLALTLLGPMIVNILFFHTLMAPSGLLIAVIVALLWFLIFWHVRRAFVGIFQQKVPD